MSASTRFDLAQGAVQGAALSALLWTLILMPPEPDAALLLLIAAASALGAFTADRARRWLAAPLLYTVALAGLRVSGPAAALLGCFVVCTLSPPFWSRPGRLGRLLPRWAEVAVAASVAWIASSAVNAGALAIATHAASYTIALAITRWSVLRVAGRRGAGPATELVAVAGQALLLFPAITLALAIEHGFSSFEGSVLLPLTCLALLTAVLLWNDRVRTRAEREQRAELRGRFRCGAEALAAMIRTRDDRAEAHLRRVQELSIVVGSRLGMSPCDIEVLELAALLHDVGKVGVSDRILSKPGRLTRDERTVVERHPVIGAEILETMECPDALARIVRHHHERWDGSGYPDGLSGPAIPLGARVLAAVDTYDALTSDRPYRAALSREEASSFLVRESGGWFDPQVVTALLDCLDCVDQRGEPPGGHPVSFAVPETVAVEPTERARPIPEAQVELQALYDLSRITVQGLGLEPCLTLVACKLGTVVPYRSLVVYVDDTDRHLLRACFAIGAGAKKLLSLTVPLGERLSGWAALQRKPCIGRSHELPLERDGFRSDLEDLRDDPDLGELRSTLASPIVSGERCLGVITLYDTARAYTPEDRRFLMRASWLLAPVLERARSAGPPAAPSLTDPLTGLPNASYLRLETSQRLAADAPGFGLLAFRVLGLDPVAEALGIDGVDRVMGQVARRLAAGCSEREALVRFGPDVFLVVSEAARSDDLTRRASSLARTVEDRPLDIGRDFGGVIRLHAAHAAAPLDGDDLDAVLGTLDGRLNLAGDRGRRTIVPFRSRTALGESARSG